MRKLIIFVICFVFVGCDYPERGACVYISSGTHGTVVANWIDGNSARWFYEVDGEILSSPALASHRTPCKD